AERHQQRPSRRGDPLTALASPAGGLLGRGDERAVRRPVLRERASALVGRVHTAQVQAGRTEAHAGRIRTSPSRSTPSTSAALSRLTAIASVRYASSYTNSSPLGTSANVT